MWRMVNYCHMCTTWGKRPRKGWRYNIFTKFFDDFWQIETNKMVTFHDEVYITKSARRRQGRGVYRVPCRACYSKAMVCYGISGTHPYGGVLPPERALSVI